MEKKIEFGRIRTDNPKRKTYLNRVQAWKGTKPCVFFTDEEGIVFLGPASEQLWREAIDSWFYNPESLPKGNTGKNLSRWAEILKELLKKGTSPSILRGQTLKTFKNSLRSHPTRYGQNSSGISLGEITQIKSV